MVYGMKRVSPAYRAATSVEIIPGTSMRTRPSSEGEIDSMSTRPLSSAAGSPAGLADATMFPARRSISESPRRRDLVIDVE